MPPAAVLFLAHSCRVTQVQVLSDKSGAFSRLLGLEQPAGPQGPPCQRFAAVVDNGILLRLVSSCIAAGRAALACFYILRAAFLAS